MKYLVAVIILICASCNQEGMSDEQRQKLKEEKSARKIQRVTDADILNAAGVKGEEIYQLNRSDNGLVAQIKWVALQDTLTNPYEIKMKEAYQYAYNRQLELHDNIEDLGNGTIVFTRPELREDSIRGFWIIILEKKEVIKGLQ